MIHIPKPRTATSVIFGVNLGLGVWVFRSLIANAASHLPDAFDYPFYTWVVFQNIAQLRSFQLDGYFNTNIFYPFQGSLLFSDLLLPQSLIGWPVALAVTNPIAVFNVVFLVTLLLNLVAGWWFWGRLISRPSRLLLATLTTFLSPYFFSQLGHFQMITFWPFLAGLGLVMGRRARWWKPIFTGALITVQLLASVYLSLFMLTSIGLWYALRLWYQRRRLDQLKGLLVRGAVTAAVFVVTAAPLIAAYLNIRQAYQIDRHAGEYVTYAAQPSDVFFYSPHSLVGQSGLGKALRRFNNHVMGEIAATPGVALGGLAMLGLFRLKKNKREVAVTFPSKFEPVYFGLLVVIGLLFALGTRLTVNGAYTGIPLPYLLVIKAVPILEPIRSTGRWLFIAYLGLSYFAVQGLAKLESKLSLPAGLMVAGLMIVYVAEVVPTRHHSMEVASAFSGYVPLQRHCQQDPGVLLEYPLNQDVVGANIATNLRYKTTIMLSSLRHDCQLVNGYSGYVPDGHTAHEAALNQTVKTGDEAGWWQLLDQRDVKYLRLNKAALAPPEVATVETWLSNRSQVEQLHNSQEYTIVKLPPNDANNAAAPGS